MESKGSATLSSGGDAHQWWRWSSGQSGAIASSSSNPLNSDHAAFSASVSVSSAALSPSSGASSSSLVSSRESLRYQSRSNSTGGTSSPSNSSSGSLSPPPAPFFSPASSALPSRKKTSSTASFGRSTSTRDANTTTPTVFKKKPGLSASPATHFTSASRSALSPLHSATVGTGAGDRDIAWSLGPSKRRVKKASKAPTGGPARRASMYAPRAIRPIAEDKREERTSTTSLYSGVGGSGLSQPTMRFSSHRFSSSVADLPTLKDRVPSPASSLATTVSASSFAASDPLATCARAVWQDCILSKRRMERSSTSTSVRKRNLDDCAKSDYLNAKAGASYMAKASECGILSSCSSSSDDELSQLSSMERSFNSGNKVDDDYKLSKEEMYRELMLGANGLSSSPDFERFSPFLDEEKGLPVEIRYQLPLALGTANEIDKECTICQLRYGIGDHIVTLPCQHFFHACCVDKWLWNHTSCPLCRTEVTLDMETDVSSTAKHNFTACSQFDQDTIRRKMRSTSQSAGFRPVVPVYVELEQLECQLASLSVQEANQPKYLVCPKPKRPHSK